MDDTRIVRLASDAEPINRNGTRYRITMEIRGLDARVDALIRDHEPGLGEDKRFLTIGGASSHSPHFAGNHQRLLAFRQRLRTQPAGPAILDVGSGELPISFNDEIFAGGFLSVECLTCGTSSQPHQTRVRRFQEEVGMAYCGEERCCPCGEVIAYRLEGYRRP